MKIMKLLFKVWLLLLPLFLASGCSEKGKVTLVKRGNTTYSILIDPSTPQSVKTAAEELMNYFTKVTGASPKIVVSEQVPSTPFISLGNTSASKAAGLDPSTIPNDGFRMVTKSGNLFIYGTDTPTGKVNNLGGVTNGTANGIYTFIEDYLGVHWLMTGELGEDYSKTGTISIPELDRMESSPFNYRVQSFRSSGPLDDQWDKRMKLARVAAVSHSHAWVETITASMFDKHPKWFAEIDGKPQPPSGRYKLETTNPELVQGYANVIIETFRKNPNQYWYSLSPTDGSYGWSNSKASLALTEKDPFGSISRTPLILKFYNDVARIVGKEFPDHKLGGYIYSNYLYPPAAGLPKLEPNLALVVATHISYGYQLYRPSTRENWDNLMRTWGESAKKDGFDIYYYDLPVSIMQPNAMIWPPAPEMMNFIFSRLISYGFKGAYIYGNPVWPVFGASNYIIAKMDWNPNQDAAKILHDYYQNAFGAKATPYIEKLYDVLDTAYRKYMNAHPRANYSLTSDHLKEIYAPHYQEMEQYYLKAQAAKKEPKQQKRIDLFGEVLSLMQWNLRSVGLLPSYYKSTLTRSDEEIDQMLSNQKDDEKIIRYGNFRKEPFSKVEKTDALPDAKTQKAVIVPISGTMRMLLHVPVAGEVKIAVKAFDGRAEFIHYTLSNTDGKQVQLGAMREGRTFSFSGEEDKSYLLDIPSRGALLKLEVTGAAIAYKSNMQDNSFLVAGQKYMDSDLPLYFNVPKGLKSFNVTLGTKGAVADLYSPDGKRVGQMNCNKSEVSRLDIPGNDSRAGFWKIIIHKFGGSSVTLTLDAQLPQWLIPDPAQPLKIVTN